MGHQGEKKVTWELHIINIITTTNGRRGTRKTVPTTRSGKGGGVRSILYTLVQLLHVYKVMSFLLW